MVRIPLFTADLDLRRSLAASASVRPLAMVAWRLILSSCPTLFLSFVYVVFSFLRRAVGGGYDSEKRGIKENRGRVGAGCCNLSVK